MARTIRGYRATCNSTKENTFLLINGFLTPGGTDSFNMHDSLLSICSNIHVTTPSVTSEKLYNWHQVSSHDLVYFYFSPIHPYSLSPTLSYLINNFYFFSNIKNLTPKLELSSSLLLTETQIAISNVNYRLARLFTIHYKSLLDKKVSWLGTVYLVLCTGLNYMYCKWICT